MPKGKTINMKIGSKKEVKNIKQEIQSLKQRRWLGMFLSLGITRSKTIQEEVMKLKETQKQIESWINNSNKPQKYLWEHELGWIDLELEINELQRLATKAIQHNNSI